MVDKRIKSDHQQRTIGDQAMPREHQAVAVEEHAYKELKLPQSPDRSVSCPCSHHTSIRIFITISRPPAISAQKDKYICTCILLPHEHKD